MNYLSTVMESTYSTAKICDVDEDPETCVPSLELEPDLTEMFTHSRDAARLKHAWVEWRKVSGNQYRQAYLDFIGINTEAATSLGKWILRFSIWIDSKSIV